MPLAARVTLDARVFVFATSLGLLSTLLIGVMPAWQSTRADVVSALKEQTSRWHGRWHPRDLVVGAQVMLSTLLLVAALLVTASLTRAGRVDVGFSANKVAALGENVVLLANLVGSAWLYARFLRGRASFAALERWQTAYLPVYFAWAWFVVIAFPPLFGFR